MYRYKSIHKQKVAFVGHVLHGSSGESILQILERKMNSKAAQGRPRQMWLDYNALDQAE